MFDLEILDFHLPEDRIAQNPAEPRDASRLLVVNSGEISHKHFRDLPELLQSGDLLILNDTLVSARRLFGSKKTGGKVEALLLENLGSEYYRALVKPGKKLAVGSVIQFDSGLSATITEIQDEFRILKFSGDDVPGILQNLGTVPLPPYIKSTTAPGERYQTIYANKPGSAAAPTAGLHFTNPLLERLENKGIAIAKITLDVGVDTFRPINTERTADHKMHGERYQIPVDTAQAITNCKGRIVAVGTTSARALETASIGRRQIRPGSGVSKIFITPGYEFKIVDAMVTNFHMPRTTMLLMLAALMGAENLMNAYQVALAEGYRFLSFGDSMLVTAE